MTPRPRWRNRYWVYVASDDRGVVLYIGATGSLCDRLRSHRSSDWWKHLADFEAIPYSSWEDALEAEDNLIWSLGPIFNRPSVRDFSIFGLEQALCLDTLCAIEWREGRGIPHDAWLATREPAA